MNQFLKTSIRQTRELSRKCLDFVFPQHCFGCGKVHEPSHISNLCIFCWNQIHKPKRYVFPAMTDFRIHIAGKYDDLLKRMLIMAKFKRNILCVDLLSNLVQETFYESAIQPDVITSIPSYYYRNVYRGLDLPAILANELSKKIGITYDSRLLRKRKYIKRQSKLSETERRENVRGLFRASNKIRGKNILVLDDILTTGSTAIACYKALQKRNPKSVVFLACAKT